MDICVRKRARILTPWSHRVVHVGVAFLRATRVRHGRCVLQSARGDCHLSLVWCRPKEKEIKGKRRRRPQSEEQSTVPANSCAWDSEWDFNFGTPRVMLFLCVLQLLMWTDYFGQRDWLPRWLVVGPLAYTPELVLAYVVYLYVTSIAKKFHRRAAQAIQLPEDPPSSHHTPSPTSHFVSHFSHLNELIAPALDNVSIVRYTFWVFFLGMGCVILVYVLSEKLGWKAIMAFFCSMMLFVYSLLLYVTLAQLSQTLNVALSSPKKTTEQKETLSLTLQHLKTIRRVFSLFALILQIFLWAFALQILLGKSPGQKQGNTSEHGFAMTDPLFKCCTDPNSEIYYLVQKLSWDSYITVWLLRVGACYCIIVVYYSGLAVRRAYKEHVKRAKRIELGARLALQEEQRRGILKTDRDVVEMEDKLRLMESPVFGETDGSGLPSASARTSKKPAGVWTTDQILSDGPDGGGPAGDRDPATAASNPGDSSNPRPNNPDHKSESKAGGGGNSLDQKSPAVVLSNGSHGAVEVVAAVVASNGGNAGAGDSPELNPMTFMVVRNKSIKQLPPELPPNPPALESRRSDDHGFSSSCLSAVCRRSDDHGFSSSPAAAAPKENAGINTSPGTGSRMRVLPADSPRLHYATVNTSASPRLHGPQSFPHSSLPSSALSSPPRVSANVPSTALMRSLNTTLPESIDGSGVGLGLSSNHNYMANDGGLAFPSLQMPGALTSSGRSRNSTETIGEDPSLPGGPPLLAAAFSCPEEAPQLLTRPSDSIESGNVDVPGVIPNTSPLPPSKPASGDSEDSIERADTDKTGAIDVAVSQAGQDKENHGKRDLPAPLRVDRPARANIKTEILDDSEEEGEFKSVVVHHMPSPDAEVAAFERYLEHNHNLGNDPAAAGASPVVVLSTPHGSVKPGEKDGAFRPAGSPIRTGE
eukprot:g24883.t1